MKNISFLLLSVVMSLISLPALSQKDSDSTATLGMAGDNLDLYAVLDLFQKSKTIEGFEKSLNDEKEKINNLDLNLDKKVDFIKVTTTKKDDSYTFVLQVDVSKKETQDVAVILLDKDKDKKISLQIVGDPELYGKDYVIEPKGNSSITANPGYVGPDPVTKDVPATNTVVVQSAPIVQYVYSPAYVPYAPPYYYGYYPPWFGFATVMAVGIYRSNHYYHHHGYYGGHYGGGNTVIINNNNRNSINHYNSNNRNTSASVSDNRAKGNYGNGSGGRGSASTRPSTSPSNRPGTGGGPSASTRPSNNASNRAGAGPSTSNRQSPSASTRQSSNFSSQPRSSNMSSGSRSMGSGGRSMGGGGRSMGGGGGRRR